MYTLSGIIAAEGIAAGPAFFIEQNQQPDLIKDNVNFDSQAEINLFLQKQKEFSNRLYHAMTGPAPDSVRDLFGAATGFISDKKNTTEIIKLIQDGVSASSACNTVFFERLKPFSQSNDQEIKKLSRELSALTAEFIASLNKSNQASIHNTVLKERCVIVAKNLTPASLLCLRTEYISAVILEEGLASGHLGAVLRELRVPAIFGVQGALQIKANTHVLVDAINGQIIVEPPYDTSQKMLLNTSYYDQFSDEDSSNIICVSSAVGASKDYDANLNYAKYGIGLLRSEFLFLGDEVEPSEEQMIIAFKNIFEKIPQQAPIKARTFDFAEDKKPNFAIDTDDTGPLKDYGAKVSTRLLKKQLRALLQAVKNRNITIVFPLIVRISEAKYLNALVASVYDELMQEGKEPCDFEVALMIETPATVLSAAAFAKYTSQFIIGTSSLAQYACAPRPYDQSFTPALAKMIALACKAANDAKIPICIAGRFAHRSELLAFFIHLGMTSITVDSSSIARIKSCIDKFNLDNKNYFNLTIYDNVMSLSSGKELNALVEKLNLEGF